MADEVIIEEEIIMKKGIPIPCMYEEEMAPTPLAVVYQQIQLFKFSILEKKERAARFLTAMLHHLCRPITMPRILGKLPFALALPLAKYILRKKGYCCVEMFYKMGGGAEYGHVWRDEKGYRIRRSICLIEKWNSVNKEGEKIGGYNLIPTQRITLTTKNNGRYTLVSSILKFRRPISYNNLTKNFLFSTKSRLINAFIAISLGLRESASPQEIHAHQNKMVYPWLNFNNMGVFSNVKENNNVKFLWVSGPQELLRNFGIPPVKSLTRLLAERLTEEGRNTYLHISIAAIVWYLTRDINHTYKVLKDNFFMPPTPCTHIMLDGYKKMWKKVYTYLGKNPKKLVSFVCRPDIRDVVTALVGLHKVEFDFSELKWGSFDDLHDSAVQAYQKVLHPQQYALHSKEFEYEEKFKELIEHANKSSNYKFILPENGHSLVKWGNELHNCASLYIHKILEGNSYLVGVYTQKVFTHLLEIDRNKNAIIQLRSKYNKIPAQEVVDEVCTILQYDVMHC